MARSLTEAQLLALVLHTDDPRNQSGLVMAIPEGVELVEVENTYVFSGYPEEKIYCAKCRAERHMKGFTALLADGARILLGSKCGSDIFGASWEVATRNLRALQNQQANLIFLSRVTGALPEIRKAHAAWYSTCDHLDASRKRFLNTFPELWEALGSRLLFDRGGRLTVEERIRDRGEELKESNKGPRYKTVERVVHIIQGQDYLTGQSAVSLWKSVYDTLEALSKREGIDPRKLAALCSRVTKAREALMAIHAQHAAALDFFSPGHLAGLSDWCRLSQSVRKNFVVRGRELCDADDETARIGIHNIPIALDGRAIALLHRKDGSSDADQVAA